VTDRAKEALKRLRYVTHGEIYQKQLDLLESELRRCRAQTLREVADRADWSTLIVFEGGRQFVARLRRMAEEAEREAGDGR
jgi:hypothetical protein